MQHNTEFSAAQSYFNRTITLSNIHFNSIKEEDNDNDDLMIREENGTFVSVDPYFTRFPSPDDQYRSVSAHQEQQFYLVNTEYNLSFLRSFMEIAGNRILQRMQAHVCTSVRNLIIGSMTSDQWQLVSMLSPLEATKKLTHNARYVNGAAFNMPVSSVRYTIKYNPPFWKPEHWGKRYFDCSNAMHRLVHCELKYITLRFSHYDKRVSASFRYVVWKYLQDNELSGVPAHWVKLS